MNLCLNAFVIQFPDDLLDTCLVTAPRALLLPFAHRGHCKDEDSYKECSSHVEFSISLTMVRRNHLSPISAFHEGDILVNGMHAFVFSDCDRAKQAKIAMVWRQRMRLHARTLRVRATAPCSFWSSCGKVRTVNCPPRGLRYLCR